MTTSGPLGPPRGVKLSVEGSSDGRLVASWSPPAEDGGSAITGYTVTFSRPGWTSDPGALSASASRHFLTGARPGTTYTVRVVARNSLGSSREASASVTTSGPLGPPRGVKLSVEGSSDGRLVASWSPPAEDGGSAITGYTVTIVVPDHTVHPLSSISGFTLGPYRLTASARRYSSSTNLSLVSGVTYEVRVAARNSLGLSRDATASITAPRLPSTRTRCPSSASGKKFDIKGGGRWPWDPKRVVARQDFTATHVTVNSEGNLKLEKKKIEKGTVGGRVSSESNLSHDGCSWIFQDAVGVWECSDFLETLWYLERLWKVVHESTETLSSARGQRYQAILVCMGMPESGAKPGFLAERTQR